MLNCVIIDDEPLAIQVLQDYVNKTPYLHLCGSFEEPLQALSVLETNRVDLLFLDIKMPDITGVDFYRSLTKKPEVIFTTAYSEYALTGFELKAIDYLLKPISFEMFITATNRVRDLLENKREAKEKDFFFINVSHKMHKIFFDDINYLEGYKDYTKIHLEGMNNPLLVLHNLKYFEDMLEKKDFVRIHRSYIIPIRKVNIASRKSVTIRTQELPVSDNYREGFLSLIEQHIR